MGEVYEVEHIEHARRVALKVLAARLGTAEDRHRFLQEGRLAASIRHPNTVYVFGSEEISGVPVITMELLPGGTLKDRLDRDGRLRATEAVDTILAVVDGLAAAQAGGILHRDIKPSNCFIDTDGTVKVGDFGLSISTRSQNLPQTIPAGSFRGTPEYAPPEQVRGEPLDVRSDIYAVGAMLFTLLTGRPPFEAATLEGLFTRVVVDPPPSPRWSEESVPEGLASVVVRCLAKDPDDRPQTYPELAEQLRPFSRAAASPARLGVRFAAGAIDRLIVNLAAAALTLVLVALWPTGRYARAPGAALPLVLAAVVLYFSLTEWAFGASPGKWLMGLRVTGADGEPLTFGRSLVRAGGYVVALNVVAAFLSGAAGQLVPTLAPPPPIGGPPPIPLETGVGTTVILAALFAPARRRNVYAALHDRFSHSRVVVARPADASSAATATVEPHPVVRQDKIGPYAELETAPRWIPDQLSAGYDEVLRRPVWIVAVPPGTPAFSAKRQNLRRPGRLRWLNGRRSPDAWDAFEAVAGRPFEIAAREHRDWATVRVWLRDLAEELRDGLGDGSLPALEFDRVWITEKGRAMLLDWPASTEPGVSRASGGVHEPTEEGARAFLVAIATRAAPAAAPLAARSFLTSLAAGEAGSPALWAETMSALCGQQADVSRRRWGHVLGAASFPLSATMACLLLEVRLGSRNSPHFLSLGVLGELFLVVVAAGLASAAMFRGGLALRVIGIRIVSNSGRPAGRLRAFGRALVAWAPLLALGLVTFSRVPRSLYWDSAISNPPSLDWVSLTAVVVCGPLAVAGWLYAIRYPDRSLQDRIAGTWLVPK